MTPGTCVRIIRHQTGVEALLVAMGKHFPTVELGAKSLIIYVDFLFSLLFHRATLYVIVPFSYNI